MLVLRRKAGDGFAVGDSVNITILGVDPSGTVSIGIDAPRDVLILRSELRGRQCQPGFCRGCGLASNGGAA